MSVSRLISEVVTLINFFFIIVNIDYGTYCTNSLFSCLAEVFLYGLALLSCYMQWNQLLIYRLVSIHRLINVEHHGTLIALVGYFIIISLVVMQLADDVC